MIFDLTPIMERGGLLFKRDDLFRPFSYTKMNGSKLRQKDIETCPPLPQNMLNVNFITETV